MKKITFFIVSLALLISACSPATTGNTCYPEFQGTKHVFVATAFGMETLAVESRVDVISQCTSNGIVYTLANLDKYQIVIFQTGVGPTNATQSTNYTLENFNVELLVFSGIAGGIDPNLEIGNTVVPTAWYDLGTDQRIQIDETLLNIAKGLTNTGFPSSVSFPDNGITSPEFVSDEELVTKIRSDHGSSVVDMETFWIANISKSFNTPFIAVRSVSDYADGQKDKSHYQEAADASANVALRFILLYFASQAP